MQGIRGRSTPGVEPWTAEVDAGNRIQYSNLLPSPQVFDCRALSVPSLTASRALVD
jgi:hypothetical protein